MDMNQFRKFLNAISPTPLLEDANATMVEITNLAKELLGIIKPETSIKRHIEQTRGQKITVQHTQTATNNQITHVFNFVSSQGNLKLRLSVSKPTSPASMTGRKRILKNLANGRSVLDVYIETSVERAMTGKTVLAVEKFPHISGERIRSGNFLLPTHWFPTLEI